MSETRYLIAQYTSDLLRKEPRNVGIVVEAPDGVQARFLGEIEPGLIDGRKIQSFKAPDVFRQWVDHWRSALTSGAILDELAEDHGQYRMIRGGIMLETGGDSCGEIADFLFERLVVGDFSTALALAEGDEAHSPPSASLGDEVEEALERRHLLVSARDPDVFITVKYPVRRRPELKGASRATYRPDFFQENGRKLVIEAVDLTGSRPKYVRDHAGHVAYMFTDLEKAAPGETDSVAIIRVTDEARQRAHVQDGLWMLQQEARVVNWFSEGERAAFLGQVERSARG